MVEQISVDEYIKLVQRNDVGKIVPDPPTNTTINKIDQLSITRFAYALGDDNPLWINPAYAAKTRYGCVIAPPTIVAAHRYPGTPGVADHYEEFNSRSFYAGAELQWFDVIRVNDTFRSEGRRCTDVVKKTGRRTGDFAIVYMESPVYNQHDELLCKVKGWSIKTPKITEERDITKGDLLFQREIYKYTQEERDRIIKDIKSEVRRGSKPRLWEDVKVGDELTPVVKGPLTIADLISIDGVTSGPGRSFELNYYDMEKTLRPSVHPITGWKIGGHWEHYDPILCRNAGLPLPFDLGNGRTVLACHILTNWMGDDAFIRKLSISMRNFFYDGDTMWYSGEIVKKEETKEGNAVEINFKAVNQLGEIVSPGTATILLPTRTEEVHLPIPH